MIPSNPLTLALSCVGWREGKNNDNPFSTWYGQQVGQDWNHQPYCAAFISWCFHEAGYPLPEMQSDGFSGFASCEIGLSYCRQHSLVTDKPVAGDLVFFLAPNGKAEHVEFFLGFAPAGSIISVGGNTGHPQGIWTQCRPKGISIVFATPAASGAPSRKGPCWIHNECPV